MNIPKARLKMQRSEIDRIGDGKYRFVHEFDDVMIWEHPRPSVKGWTFTIEGHRIISVNAKLRRQERRAVIRELLSEDAVEVQHA